MQTFKPRTTAPAADDKNWIHYTKGGTNYCIIIHDNSVLANCVGYAWGRWSELLQGFHGLSRGNAEDWWGKSDGYARGQTPKLGAIACWKKGKAGYGSDGAGHVSVVEQINEDNSIITSNSNFGGTPFFMRTLKAPYDLGTNYTFQGFIYPPLNFVTPVVQPTKSNADVAKEVINGIWGNGADRKAKLTASGYNYSDIQTLVDQLLAPVPEVPKKSTDELAKEVINGIWGNGADRKSRLTAAGFNYAEVQAKVDALLAHTNPKKSIDQVAREVINGDWGNGIGRQQSLINAGYDAKQVQARVNQLLK